MTIQRIETNLFPFERATVLDYGGARADLTGSYAESSSNTRLISTTISGSRQTMSTPFNGVDTKGPKFKAGQWYFGGCRFTTLSAVLDGMNFRLLVNPESGNQFGKAAGVGMNGIFFKFDSETSSDFIWGINVTGSGESAGIDVEYGDPFMMKVDNNINPANLAPVSLSAAFDFEQENTISGTNEGLVTFVQGDHINSDPKKTIMLSADSQGVLKGVDSYIQLYQKNNPEIQTFPNGVAGRDLNDHNNEWTSTINLSVVKHQLNLNIYFPFYDSTRIIRPQVLGLGIGFNDVDGGATQGQIEARFETAFSNAESAGLLVIVFTIGPNDSWSAGQNTIRNDLNIFLKGKAASDGNILVYDFDATVNDAGNSLPDKINPTFDDGSGFHINALGNIDVEADFAVVANQAFNILSVSNGVSPLSMFQPISKSLSS